MPYQEIEYGGFRFDFLKLSVDETVLYGPNGIDQIGTELTFNIKGVFSARTVEAFRILMATVECKLSTPRLGFTVRYSEDNMNWSTDYSVEFNEDIKWGPKPGKLEIHEIIGGRSVLYTWSLTTATKKCYASDCALFNRPSNVLSISRQFNHNVDANGLTTRTITGKMVVTSSSAFDGKPADFYRNLVTPPMPKWYSRQGESYVQNEDGTQLDFSIVDVEKVWILPVPITSGHASWRVAVSQWGMNINYSLSGEFTAPISASKAQIMQQIGLLALNRFPLNAGATIIFEDSYYDESVYENKVSFGINARTACDASPGLGPAGAAIAAFNGLATGLATAFTTFGDIPPGNEEGNAQQIGSYGGDGKTVNSGLIAPSPKIYDACFPPFSTRNGGNGGSQQIGQATAGILPTGQGAIIIPGGDTALETALQTSGGQASQAHIEAPYFAYNEEISYEIDNGWETFYPKIKGAKPRKQQVRNPKMMIVQCGYAQRDATSSKNAPRVPIPIFSDITDAVIVRRNTVNASVPLPLGTGNANRYKIEWNYLIEYMLPMKQEADLDLVFPRDPRRAGALPEPITNLPPEVALVK